MTANVDCQLDLESPRDKSLQMFFEEFSRQVSGQIDFLGRLVSDRGWR